MTEKAGTNFITFTGLSADSSSFSLAGGVYAFAVKATWGGGSADLQMLMPDGSSYLSVLAAPFTADGDTILDMPSGTYKVAIATATAVQGGVWPVPVSARA